MSIPLFFPSITKKEIDSVTEVLKGGWLSQGEARKKFEDLIAKKCNRKYAISVNSGTSALHVVLMALGIKEGDEIITTPYSFIATANAILYVGAKPIFVDIDQFTYNLDPKLIEKSITKKTKAILAVEVLGNTSHFEEYERIAKKHNIYLIEDSCEAIGAKMNGRSAGSFGICSVFGFFPNKQITTGEGGMILTNDECIRNTAISLSNHGKDETGQQFLRLGYNFKMNEVTAAIGHSQLERLDEILEKRRKVAEIYKEYLKDIKEICLPPMHNLSESDVSSWFMYVIRLQDEFDKDFRDDLVNLLTSKGIGCGTNFKPIHLQRHFVEAFKYKLGDFKECERISSRTIVLPFYSELTRKDIEIVVQTFKECLNEVIKVKSITRSMVL